MRLINCRGQPLCLEEFEESAVPPFAILSHTWAAEEVTYQHFAELDTRASRKGWAKLERACSMALECGYDFIWNDTCCIDKQNNAELTESINSMFQWYGDASVCLTYISDFDAATGDTESLRSARWFTRGWTLQELIAPPAVYFYDKNWRLFGTRSSLHRELSSITGISADILSRPADAAIRDLLDEIPVARRMSWAATRRTTKKEDIAYCLLGVFGVNMPMLYGEGAQAFVRLQEEIIRDSNDLTLFAWVSKALEPSGAPPGSRTEAYRGVLASGPDEFSGAANIEPVNDSKFNPDYSMSNKGLRIQTVLHSTNTGDVVMPLFCRFAGDSSTQLGVFLKPLGASLYTRARPQHLGLIRNGNSTSAGATIFVTKRVKPSITRTLGAAHRNAFHLNFAFSPADAVRLVETTPTELWDAENQLFVTSGLQHFTAFHRFQVLGSMPGQFVFACGVSEGTGPWVCVDDETGPLFSAASARNLQVVSDVGRSRGRAGDIKQDLLTLAPNSTFWKVRFAVAKVKWAAQTVRGEPGIVVTLKVSRNTPMGLHV